MIQIRSLNSFFPIKLIKYRIESLNFIVIFILDNLSLSSIYFFNSIPNPHCSLQLDPSLLQLGSEPCPLSSIWYFDLQLSSLGSFFLKIFLWVTQNRIMKSQLRCRFNFIFWFCSSQNFHFGYETSPPLYFDYLPLESIRLYF